MHLQDQSAAPIVIAHSHGGNVALRALSHLGDASRVRVVTLATPFLRVFARDPPEINTIVWILLWAVVAVLTGLPAVLVVAWMFPAIKGLTAFYVAMGVLAVAALLALLILRWMHRVFVNPQSRSQRGGSLAHDIQDAAFYPPIGASGPRMLVIRGVDDEASLTLAAGAIGSRLSSFVLLVLIPGVYMVGIVLLVFQDWSGLSEEWAGILFPIVIYGCAFAAFVCLFLPGMCKSVFGREFLTAAFVCETAADSAPDTSAKIDSVTLTPIAAGWGLRHCIYDHPNCVDEIVQWICGGMQNPGDNAKGQASV
jgi:hypothetical protein